MFVNIMGRMQSAFTKSGRLFSRVAEWGAEHDDHADDRPWQETGGNFTVFDFTTTCVAFVFLLFLNLYY